MRIGPEVQAWHRSSCHLVLIETAKLHDVDPAHYLREAVRTADRGEALLPWNLVGREARRLRIAVGTPSPCTSRIHDGSQRDVTKKRPSERETRHGQHGQLLSGQPGTSCPVTEHCSKNAPKNAASSASQPGTIIAEAMPFRLRRET